MFRSEAAQAGLGLFFPKPVPINALQRSLANIQARKEVVQWA
jgi:hypothetical protein